MGDDQPTSESDARALWSTAYAHLTQDPQISVRDRSILKDLVPTMIWDSMLMFTASSDFIRVSVEKKFDQLVRDALSQAAGKTMNYVIKLDPGQNRPAESEPITETQSGTEPAVNLSARPTWTSRPPVAAQSLVPPAVPLADPVPTAQTDPTAQAVNPVLSAAPNQAFTTPAPVTESAAPTRGGGQARAMAVPPSQSPLLADRPLIQDTFPSEGFLRPDKAPHVSHRDEQSHLNKDATFDSFVPGESNRFAKAAAFAVAEAPGNAYNPLFIYGGSGLGKTHLLNAIGNYALTLYPDLRVKYVNSEEFTNEFIEAVARGRSSDGQITEFNQRYREVDLLLIDDIQFLGGKVETLQAFFNTFNALYNANKQIVVASDVAPKLLDGFEDRIVSRFEQGLPVDIQPPNQETRVAILRIKASTSKLKSEIPLEVLDLIAQRVTDNVRELEGALTRVEAMASLNKQPVTTALAEQTLQDYFVSEVQVTPTDIISQTANYFQLTFDDLVSSNRSKAIALPRMIAMYICRELTGLSLTAIGETFGGRDHTTVIHAYQRISSEMSERREVYNYVSELTAKLKQGMQ